MRPQLSGIGQGLAADAERVQMRTEGVLQELRQQLGVTERESFLGTGQTSLSGADMAIVPAPTVAPFADSREPRPRGLIDAFVKTCQRWQLSESQQLILLGYGENAFFGRQILQGRWLVSSQDVKDRTGYILAISLGLGSIFNEMAEAELRWLKTNHEKLSGRSPLTIMLEGKMSNLMIVAAIVADERGL